MAMNAKAVLGVAALFATVAFAGSTTATTPEGRPTLYVFLQTDAKSAVLEKALQAKLPTVAVTVFGRFRDFDEALSSKSPDAVLALQPVLAARKLEPVLRGTVRGRDVDDFVLLFGGTPVDGSLANRTIGAVDFLGRKGTQELAAKLLNEPTIRIKLVTRVEDLLSLLQFSAADAVLVPSDVVKTFAERSRLALHVRVIPNAAIGRAALAVLTPAAGDLVAQVRSLDSATNQMMAVDGWRPR